MSTSDELSSNKAAANEPDVFPAYVASIHHLAPLLPEVDTSDDTRPLPPPRPMTFSSWEWKAAEWMFYIVSVTDHQRKHKSKEE